jgi:hypothetical protein
MANDFQTRRAINVPLRPLNKGIITEVQSNALPQGAVVDAQNCEVVTQGIKKRSGYLTPYDSDDLLVAAPPVRGIATFWKTDGTQVTVVMDSMFIYVLSASGLTPVFDTYAVGTCSVAFGSDAVTGVGTLWNTVASDVRVGDVIVFDPDGLVNGPEAGQIKTINSDTSITLEFTVTAAHAAGTPYEIRRVFNIQNNKHLDYTTLANKLVITDGTRTLRSYDGSTYGEYSTDITEVVDCITYHRDRLWAARVTDAIGNVYRTRLIWTSTVDLTDFTPSGADLSIDRPYQTGEIKAIKPLGDFLAVYYEDRIDLFRPTNVGGNALPLAPIRLESNNIGIVGLKAVTKMTEGHFFVGQDDVYYLGTNTGLVPLNSPVKDDLLAFPDTLWNAWAVTIPALNAVKIGIPDNTGLISKVWNYNYKSKAWSYDPIDTGALANNNILQNFNGRTSMFTEALVESVTWEEAVGTWNDNTYSTWVGAASGTGYVFLLCWGFKSSGDIRVNRSFKIQQLSKGITQDTLTTTTDIQSVIETGDLDFNAPDKNKSYTRISAKLLRSLVTNLEFTVEGSVDYGDTWRTLGTLDIPIGKTEAHVDFMFTGSTGRFRLTTAADNEQFTVTEFVVRVIGRGLEVQNA